VWDILANKEIRWDRAKNTLLVQERAVCFEDIQVAIEGQVDILDIYPHVNIEKYAHQFILAARIKDYVYLVPFVPADEHIFLKTIYKSRAATKKYLAA
jgi:uncharacterized DUF497 family protein